MRATIQRVSFASIEVDKQLIAKIDTGLLVLVGFENDDAEDDLEWMAKKICGLRIFPDQQNVMNLSVKEVDGDVLSVSQFTLHASTKKGNRPSYIKAAKPDVSIPLYERFNQLLIFNLNKEIQTGEFGADMKISLLNDGPVTINIDSKNKE